MEAFDDRACASRRSRGCIPDSAREPAVTRLVLAVVALVIAGMLSGIGPYADIRQRMAPRAPFEEAPAASVDDMVAALERIGADGRAAYARQLAVDVVVIVTNATWLGLWLLAVGRRTLGGWARRVVPAAVTALPALADLSENVALGLVLGAHPAPSAWLVQIASNATRVKLALFVLAVAVALAQTAVVVARQIGRRRGP